MPVPLPVIVWLLPVIVLVVVVRAILVIRAVVLRAAIRIDVNAEPIVVNAQVTSTQVLIGVALLIVIAISVLCFYVSVEREHERYAKDCY